MFLRTIAKSPIPILLSFALVIFSAQTVFSHGGEKHGSGLDISLPEVAAQVNGADISKIKIEKYLGMLVHNAADNGKKLSATQQKTAAKKLIDEEINKELLLLKAKELGIVVSPEQAMKARKPASILLKEAVLEKEIGSKINISETQVKGFYEKNQSLFMGKEQVRASVILIKVNAKKGPGGEKDSRDKMLKLADKIKNGADFALVAKESSQDSLAARGGDLGFFSRDARIPAVFKKHAFSLEVGSVSEVFSTRHGLHLMKATEKKPGGLSPLEKEKGRIEKMLKHKEIKKRTPEYVQTLRENAKVQVYF